MSKELRRDDVVVPEGDDLAKDLLRLLTDAGINPKNKEGEHLMMSLTSYVVRRDHTIFNHGVKVGKAGK